MCAALGPDQDLAQKILGFLYYSNALDDAFPFNMRQGEMWFTVHILATYPMGEYIPLTSLKANLVNHLDGHAGRSIDLITHVVKVISSNGYVSIHNNDELKSTYDTSRAFAKNGVIDMKVLIRANESFYSKIEDYAAQLIFRTFGPQEAGGLSCEASINVVRIFFASIMDEFRAGWQKLAKDIVATASSRPVKYSKKLPDAAKVYNSTAHYLLVHLIWRASLLNPPGATKDDLLTRVEKMREPTQGYLETAFQNLSDFGFAARVPRDTSMIFVGEDYISLLKKYEAGFRKSFQHTRERLRFAIATIS